MLDSQELRHAEGFVYTVLLKRRCKFVIAQCSHRRQVISVESLPFFLLSHKFYKVVSEWNVRALLAMNLAVC